MLVWLLGENTQLCWRIYCFNNMSGKITKIASQYQKGVINYLPQPQLLIEAYYEHPGTYLHSHSTLWALLVNNSWNIRASDSVCLILSKVSREIFLLAHRSKCRIFGHLATISSTAASEHSSILQRKVQCYNAFRLPIGFDSKTVRL